MSSLPARPRVLFLCTGNSCRSQMAEGWLAHLARDRYEALSAGTEAHGLNPRAVAAMAEVGVDISNHASQTIDAYLDDPPEVVVTVCDHAAQSCPTLPGKTQTLHASFPDPARATGTESEVRKQFAEVRDEIRDRIEGWLEQGAFG